MAPRTKKLEPPRRGRDGYYTLPDGTKCFSVTNIIQHGVPKDLTGWAGWEAGLLAAESVPKLVRVRGESERRKMAYWLGQQSTRIKKKAGELGTAVHDAIEADILGQPIAEPTVEQKPFIDAYYRFKENERPEYEATELVLAHPTDGWAGRGDVWVTLPNYGPALLMGDWKSGSGVYPEASLQLSAYRRAPVAWTKDGQEIVPPKTESAVVVHIRPEKYPDCGYRVYPMDTSDAVYESFLDARRVAINWSKGMANTVVGVPFEPILTAEIEEDQQGEVA
jgi:hypothetical protein